MDNFTFYSPTKFVFGKGTENEAGKLIKAFGGSRVLIHYGGGSVVRSGLLDRVKASLEAEDLDYVELGGVKPNPRSGLVYEGIDLVRRNGIDFILAVGGGSAIDSAKAIGYGVTNEGDVWDFYDYRRKATACLPIGVILTIVCLHLIPFRDPGVRIREGTILAALVTGKVIEIIRKPLSPIVQKICFGESKQ